MSPVLRVISIVIISKILISIVVVSYEDNNIFLTEDGTK